MKFTPLVLDIGGNGVTPTITPTFDSSSSDSLAIGAGLQENLKITLTNSIDVQSIDGASPSYATIKEL